jgi:type II secretory pathway pseudopilin PulG
MGRILHPAYRVHSPRSSQRGDTIVEVLISLAVIASLMAGAFVVSRSSSVNVRTSQEHAEALQLLQGQVEMLRAEATSVAAGTTWTPPAANFCMDQAPGGVNYGKAIAAGGASSPCSISNNGSAYTYDVSITKDTSAAARSALTAGFGETYVFSVSWDALAGGQNTESIVYRVPKV